MLNCNCNCSYRCGCTVASIIAAILIGVLAAFFQITAAITVTTAFLWVLFGIAVVYLAALVVAGTLARYQARGECRCASLSTVLAGILGTILVSVILLGFGIVATSIATAILVGLLLFFFTLTIVASACYVRSLAECSE